VNSKYSKTKNKPRGGNIPLKGIGEGVNSIKLNNDQPSGKVPQEYRGIKIKIKIKIKINKQTNFSTLKLKILFNSGPLHQGGYKLLELNLIKCMLSHPAFIFKFRLLLLLATIVMVMIIGKLKQSNNGYHDR
jgi:hypothetical protein